MSAGRLWHWASKLFPRMNAVAQIWHRLVVNWRKAGYRDRWGTRWLIKTANEFLEDLPYSRSTVYRALRLFEKLGLIVKIQKEHLYRYETGKDHCNWIALRWPGEGGYRDREVPEKASKKTIRKTHFASITMNGAECVDHNPSLIKPSGKKTSSPSGGGKVEASRERRGNPFLSKIFRADRAGPCNYLQDGAAMNLDDVMAGMQTRLNPRKTGKLDANEAVRLYQKACRAHWPDEPAPAATRKTTAMMKTLLTRLREEKFSDEAIRDFLDHMIVNWEGVRTRVKERTGRRMAERPDLGAVMHKLADVIVYVRPMLSAGPNVGPVGAPAGDTPAETAAVEAGYVVINGVKAKIGTAAHKYLIEEYGGQQ